MKNFLTLLPIVIILLGCGGIVEPGSGQKSRTKLIAGFSSHSIPQEVSASMPALTRITVLENSRHPARGDCPRFDIYTIAASGWSHLGFSGTLELNFVNEALYRTSFYPDSIEAYLNRLETTGLKISAQTTVVNNSSATIRYATNWNKQKYVSWTDRKISEELKSWIRSCA